MMYWNGWMYIFLMIGNLVFWGVVIYIAVSAARSWNRPERNGPAPGPVGPVGPVGPADRDPERILAERFAHGELDAEEYRMRLRVLREHRPDAPGS